MSEIAKTDDEADVFDTGETSQLPTLHPLIQRYDSNCSEKNMGLHDIHTLMTPDNVDCHSDAVVWGRCRCPDLGFAGRAHLHTSDR